MNMKAVQDSNMNKRILVLKKEYYKNGNIYKCFCDYNKTGKIFKSTSIEFYACSTVVLYTFAKSKGNEKKGNIFVCSKNGIVTEAIDIESRNTEDLDFNISIYALSLASNLENKRNTE